MFETLFKRDETVRRYLAYCAKQGAKHSTLSGIAATQLALVRRLDLDGAVPIRLSQVEDAAQQWASGRPGRNLPKVRRTGVRLAPLRRSLGSAATATGPAPGEGRAFTAYMRWERGLAEPKDEVDSGAVRAGIASVLHHELVSHRRP